MRLRVLAEEPVCAVAGCGEPSTSVDHRIPLALGGSPLDRANLQGMCARHNSAKGATAWWEDVPRPNACTCGDPTCLGTWHL